MSHVLIINPNTRQALTAQLVDQICALLAGSGVDVQGVTAPFGADYIASESSYVVAAHAVQDAWQTHVCMQGRPRAVLVACFGDPGVWALRETAGVPVMGMAEAAMREAQALGPFGIVTGGAAWGPMLERLARTLKLSGPGKLRWVRTVDASGGKLASDPETGLRGLAQACAQGREQEPVASIIVGGAALGGWADRLTPQVPDLPLIDSVLSGARWLKTAL